MGEYGEAMYQKAIEEGRAIGRHNRSVYTAKKMLQRGRDTIEEIAEITELPLEEVKELAEKLSSDEQDGD